MTMFFVRMVVLGLWAFAQVSVAQTHAQETTTAIPRHDGKPADMTKPVQVFLLLGQSNMVGLGKVKGGEVSLEHAVKEKKKYTYQDYEKYKKIIMEITLDDPELWNKSIMRLLRKISL